MWGNEITSRIISYYSEYYAKQERSKFKIDLSNYIVGGEYGLNILLHGKPKPTDMPVIYSADPYKEGRELTKKIYDKYNIEDSGVKAEVPELLSIDARNNNMRDIISNSVRYLNMRAVLPHKSYEICDLKRAIIEIGYDPTKGYNSITKDGQKLISPILFLIDALRQYSNPNNYDDESRVALQERLSAILEHINFDIYYAAYKQDKVVEYNTNKFPKSIVEYFMKYVHIISTETTSMFIINKSAADFMYEDARDFAKHINIKDIKSYTIDLLNDYFLEKVVIRYTKPATRPQKFDNKREPRRQAFNRGKGRGRKRRGGGKGESDRDSEDGYSNSSSDSDEADSNDGDSDSNDSNDKETFATSRESLEADSDSETREGGYEISCRYIFYTQGNYEVIPFNNEKGVRQAIPSVVLQYTLLEDNSGMTLVHNGFMKFYNYLFDKRFVADALKEPLPQLQNFYGTFKNKLTMKKKLLKLAKSNYKYFPSIKMTKDTEEP